jgi:ferrous-iron efflux pump FieF
LTESGRRARRVALNVSIAAGAIAIAKGAVGFASGSIAILSSALDSAGDAIASLVNFALLTVASKPPDAGHPFGHGKAEHLAALFQGVLLLGGSAALGWSAVSRIGEPKPVDASLLALATMIVSIVATVAITRYLRSNAAREESVALEGDALHYSSDVLANLATIVALVAIRLTGNPLFDSILGIAVAIWIAWNALNLGWNAANDLMDRALPGDDIESIIGAIEASDPAVLGYRHLRTRRAAGVRFVDFELCIDSSVSFEHAHELSEQVKARIRRSFPRTVITIHAEPMAPSARASRR